jgi:pentatricopeptide repeat protein
VVNEFEQIGTDKKTRVPVNPKEDLEVVGKYLRSKLDSLEKELAVLREGPFGPRSEFMQSLPPDVREQALEILRQEGGGSVPKGLIDMDLSELDQFIENQDLDPEDGDGIPVPQVVLHHSKERQAYVRNFNACLREVLLSDPGSSKAKKVALWQSYLRCRRQIQDFPSSLSTQIWDVLWQSQTEAHDSGRTSKTLMLAQDMLSQPSLPFSPDQLLAYMECLRSEKYLETAIQCWHDNRSILGPNTEVARRYWSLGVQLFCDDDQPEEAQNIAIQCLDHGSFVDATILMPVISSWARKNTVAGLEKAWACYLRFLAELGTKVRSEHYERLSTELLKLGQREMALAVFKDMTLKNVQQTRHDSLSTFRGVVGNLRSAINQYEVNKVSLTALTQLPKLLRNKYFYAAWIQKLGSMGEVDAAAKVVELMYERGVRPAAKHLNGIIGTWLRTGSDADRERAEKMAWAMINARITFVRNREMQAASQQSTTSSQATAVVPASTVPAVSTVSVAIARPVPPATIETFSILLLHYTRRCKYEAAAELIKAMTGIAMMEPNAYIWNHWLYSSLRAKDFPRLLSQYESMKLKVQPDLHTFLCLWEAAKIQWDPSRCVSAPNFPTARKLFKQMHDWMAQLPTAQLIRAKQEFSRELHDLIIRSFCLGRDLRGALCALHGLHQLFGHPPDTTTERIITIAIARLMPPDPKYQINALRGPRRKTSHMTGAMAQVTRILGNVSDQRTLRLIKAGKDPKELDEEARGRFRLDSLSDLLLVVMKLRVRAHAATLKNEVRQIARSMEVNVDAVDFKRKGPPLT